MTASIVLDNQLLIEAFKFTKLKIKKDLIHLALKEFIKMHKRLSLLELKGKISFEENYDYKKMIC